uniref:Ribosome-recycling factor, chloroplastic n=2 Tax=Tetraselmis sp. GSL018 TaxID=582737 RepID=A0A061QUD2_9CHLO
MGSITRRLVADLHSKSSFLKQVSNVHFMTSVVTMNMKFSDACSGTTTGKGETLLPQEHPASQQLRLFSKVKSKAKSPVSKVEDPKEDISTEFSLDVVKAEIDACIDHLRHELSNFRSGRATPEMLDFVQVEVYGERVPLKSVAAVSVRSSQLLILSVYDPGAVDGVVRAIRESSLQLNANREGKSQEIQVPVPPPTRESVLALEKLIHKSGEAAKVSIRHSRHKGLREAKKAFPSKDDQKAAERDIQKLVDAATVDIDEVVKHKISTLHA